MRRSLVFSLFWLVACGGESATNPGVQIPGASASATPAPSSTATATSTPTSSTTARATSSPTANERVEAEGLRITDLVVGTGREAKVGGKIRVGYVGTLEDGTEFDSSKKHGKPLEITIGIGMVIKGWDRGVVGMREGGKRRLVIPYPLAYGEEGHPPRIPPKSTLIFEIELVEVK